MSKSNRLYINGKDAWLTWSALLIEDSYDNLELPASPKAYVENDARSQPGKQVLVRNYQPKDRTVQLMFDIACKSKDEYRKKFKSLIAEMTGKMFELTVMPLMTVYKVYLPENCFLSLGLGPGMQSGKLSVRVNEPNPADRQSTLVTATILGANSDNEALANNDDVLTESNK